MPVLRNIAVLAACDAAHRHISDAALVWENETILWLGKEMDLPVQYRQFPTVDARRSLVIPGLIDCHTHLAFGGWRADEFEERMKGTSYLEIAKRGGGILSTVAKTRALSEEELFHRCAEFLAQMAQLGVTTVECKSGYGLDVETELKILRVYKRLRASQPLEIVPTLLAAHTVPAEYRDNREAYCALICERIIPPASQDGLARFCDVFVEKSAFSAEEARRIFSAASKTGLKPKLHADQLSDGRGAELAAEVGAVSADHLEHISGDGIAALKQSGTIAVALPLASLYTRENPLDARRLIDAGVRVALATDFNPGSAPSYHLPLAMMLGCTLCRMTPEEALRAVTINAAAAIAEEQRIGSLEAGKQCDFALIDSPSIAHWMYHFTPNACIATYKKGVLLWER